MKGSLVRETDFQEVLDDPEVLLTWDDEQLVNRFLDVRFTIMTEMRITSDINRISKIIQIGRLQHEEILRRMKEGRSEPPF